MEPGESIESSANQRVGRNPERATKENELGGIDGSIGRKEEGRFRLEILGLRRAVGSEMSTLT